jgi:hypothetical protein
LRQARTGVVITRNTRPIWSGGITNIVRSAAANTVQVTATGWLEEFDHRYVRKSRSSLNFSAIVGGQIVGTLIRRLQRPNRLDRHRAAAQASFGGTTDTQVRTRAYPRRRQLRRVDPRALDDRERLSTSWSTRGRA